MPPAEQPRPPVDGAPAPSAEARRLIDALKECSGATGVYHLCTSDAVAADTHEDAADSALSAYVAGLEADVAAIALADAERAAVS